MKKKFLFVILVILLIIGFGYFYLDNYSTNLLEKIKFIKNNKKDIIKTFVNKSDPKTEKEDINSRLDILRKKFKLKGLIESGNNFLENGYYLYALNNYLVASSKSPKDKSIVNNIAFTYFSMKNFTRAYGYYKQIKDYNKINKDDAILTLLYSKEITKENKEYFFNEIDYFNLDEEKTFYYKTSISCVEDLHRCKQLFSDYISKKEKLGLKIESKEMLNIKKAFSNYDNFQVTDLTYKNALLTGVFLENKLYPISINLGKKILSEKPGYKAIVQIIGKSYFELGEYKEAKKYLAKYLELDIENKNVLYLLGVINSELGEYILSNIYLKSALDKGYSPSINLRRRMLYNLGEVGENEKMMESFKQLIEEEPHLEKNDFYLYIYYNILYKNIDEAEKIANRGIKAFSDDSNFYGYLGWINKEKSNLAEAEKYLSKGLELNPKNPMLNLNFGELEMQRGNYSKASIYFNNTIEEDKTEDFSGLAKEELEKIKNLEQEISNP